MFRLAAFGLVFGFAAIARAEESAVTKFKNYLPQQILAMAEKERSISVPMMLVGAANLAMSRHGKLVLQANLNTLMYNGLADYEAAKKAFQNDLGEVPTGELTVWQIHILGYRASRSNMTYVSFFPFNFGGVVTNAMATVQGTAIIVDEKIAYPINHVTIKCDRSEGFCEYLQIALLLPDENSWTQSYNVGEVARENYRITHWNNNQINAVPTNNTKCRTNQLNLNFSTKEYYEIATNNTEGDCDTLLGILPRLAKPRVSQIVDGREIIDAEFKRINDEAFGYLSSAFRKQIETAGVK